MKLEPDALEALERPTIIKVLVSVLKEKTESRSGQFDTLRKYIADNLIGLLKGEMHKYDWQNANLSNVWWQGADVHDTDFYQANLRNAGLRGANLERAVFYESNLSGAVLRDARLSGANFYGASLDGVKLKDATYDKSTIWPDDFRPDEHGARLAPDAESAA